jgi:hypothetical protein
MAESISLAPTNVPTVPFMGAFTQHVQTQSPSNDDPGEAYHASQPSEVARIIEPLRGMHDADGNARLPWLPLNVNTHSPNASPKAHPTGSPRNAATNAHSATVAGSEKLQFWSPCAVHSQVEEFHEGFEQFGTGNDPDLDPETSRMHASHASPSPEVGWQY